jgi:pilus assembly protein Flp/PilA
MAERSKRSKSFTSPPGRENSEVPLTFTWQELLTRSPVHPPCGPGPEEGGVIAIRKMLRMLCAEQRGATAIEYGLIAALIILAMVGGLQSLGGGIGGMWGKLGNTANTYMP